MISHMFLLLLLFRFVKVPSFLMKAAKRDKPPSAPPFKLWGSKVVTTGRCACMLFVLQFMLWGGNLCVGLVSWCFKPSQPLCVGQFMLCVRHFVCAWQFLLCVWHYLCGNLYCLCGNLCSVCVWQFMLCVWQFMCVAVCANLWCGAICMWGNLWCVLDNIWCVGAIYVHACVYAYEYMRTYMPACVVFACVCMFSYRNERPVWHTLHNASDEQTVTLVYVYWRTLHNASVMNRMCYFSTCVFQRLNTSFSNIFSMYSEFIGMPHLRVMCRMLGYQGIAVVIEELLKSTESSVSFKAQSFLPFCSPSLCAVWRSSSVKLFSRPVNRGVKGTICSVREQVSKRGGHWWSWLVNWALTFVSVHTICTGSWTLEKPSNLREKIPCLLSLDRLCSGLHQRPSIVICLFFFFFLVSKD